MSAIERRLAILAVSAAAAATAVIVPAGPAKASTRPDFQLPFPCGEVWSGRTFTTHNPLNAIDLNQGAPGDDFGKPVVASAAGTVSTVADLGNDSYGRYIIISHGDGWHSLYAHLSGVRVTERQHVAQGERIGAVGQSGGADGSHLHYEQRNGTSSSDAVRIRFDGDEALYFGTASYRSKNCQDPSNAAPDLSVSGVTDPDGSLTVFARRDGSLATKNRRTDGTWGDWVNRGGDLASGPDAAISAAGFYHVVARGANGKVMYKRQGPEGWGDWVLTFSDFDTPYAPAIVRADADTLIAFAVRASDKALMKRRYDAGSGWGSWDRLGSGDGYTSGPDASLRDGGKIDLVIRGPGGHVVHIARDASGSWGDPHGMGDLVTAVGAAPATASRLAGTVDLLARGENGYPFRNTLGTDGTWSGWNRIFVGQLNQGPDLVADTGAGELQLLARDTEGRIVRAVWNPGQGWTDLIPIPTN